jgi:hypothetical protein
VSASQPGKGEELHSGQQGNNLFTNPLRDEPTEDEPGHIGDQERQDEEDQEECFASNGHYVRASGLDVLGAGLNVFVSFRLSLHDRKLLSLQGQGIRLAVELHPLIVADFLQDGDK